MTSFRWILLTAVAWLSGAVSPSFSFLPSFQFAWWVPVRLDEAEGQRVEASRHLSLEFRESADSHLCTCFWMVPARKPLINRLCRASIKPSSVSSSSFHYSLLAAFELSTRAHKYRQKMWDMRCRRRGTQQQLCGSNIAATATAATSQQQHQQSHH